MSRHLKKVFFVRLKLQTLFYYLFPDHLSIKLLFSKYAGKEYTSKSIFQGRNWWVNG